METKNITLQKYPAYKDSGEMWLKNIPAHWKMRKGKFLFKKQERPVREDDDIVTCFRDGQVTLRTNRRTEGFTNALKEHGYQGIRKGDLVIHAMDAFAGAIGVSDSDGKSTPVYSVCTPRIEGQVNQYYYAYFLRNMANSNIILSLAKGIRERSTDFRFKDFGELNIVSPPLEEQTAIAAFLDDKTAKIDSAITQKEKMITLLKERKQIIIQDLVTGKKVWNAKKNAWTEPTKIKDSGIEWIGEIPEGWEVKRLKYVLKLKNKKELSKNSELPYIGMENIESKSGKYIQTKSEVDGLANKFVKGNILFGKLRPYLAKVYLAEFDGICSSEFLVYENQNGEYFSKLLLSDDFIQIVNGSTYGAKMPRASSNFIGNLYIPTPSIQEQTTIVTHIKSQFAKIEKAIKLQEQQIEKLKELKATLIDSAVTGKIKVS